MRDETLAGNVWTASAHVITAVIGSGVLSLAWSISQIGWVAGPPILLGFAFITYYTALLLADCYRYPDPITGRRNYTYMDAVKSHLGTQGFVIYVYEPACVCMYVGMYVACMSAKS